MKKLTVICCLILSLFLISGCTDATADVSNKNEVLFKVGKTTYTKGDMYDKMVSDDAGNGAVAKALEIVANKEIETTPAIQARGDEIYADYSKQLEESYKEAEMDFDLEEALKAVGFESIDDFKNYCLNSAKEEALIDKYIEEHWNDLLEEYKPVKARMMQVSGTTDTMEEAYLTINGAKERVQNGENFEAVAKSIGSKDTLAAESLYTRNDSSLDYNVLQFLISAKAPTLSGVVTNKDANAYYLIQVTNVNYEQLKPEFIEFLKDDIDFIDEVHKSYMKKYNFTIYDINVYNFVKDNYPAFLVQE